MPDKAIIKMLIWIKNVFDGKGIERKQSITASHNDNSMHKNKLEDYILNRCVYFAIKQYAIQYIIPTKKATHIRTTAIMMLKM